MQSTAFVVSTDSYYFPHAGYGQLPTVPTPIETFDPPQWFSPPIHPPHSYFPNQFLPFEAPWFAESATSNLPLHDDSHDQPAGQSTSSPETTESAASPTTPTHRVQKGKRQCEAKRINTLQNDEYVESFTGTRVICVACHKSIKLDTRDGARFYPGFWLKHRGRCKKASFSWWLWRVVLTNLSQYQIGKRSKERGERKGDLN